VVFLALFLAELLTGAALAGVPRRYLGRCDEVWLIREAISMKSAPPAAVLRADCEALLFALVGV
jgi:hypothetical protein